MNTLPLLRPMYLTRQCVAKERPPTAVTSMMCPRAPPEFRYMSRCSTTQSLRVSRMAADDSSLMALLPLLADFCPRRVHDCGSDGRGPVPIRSRRIAAAKYHHGVVLRDRADRGDRKSTRLNSSH